jgi:hypothetical protein
MSPIDSYKGATKTLYCTRLNENGVPQTLDGATVQARLYRFKDPDTTIQDLDVVIRQVGPANLGEFTISITAANSNTLSRGSYLCQIRYIYAGTTDILDPFEWRIL